MIGRNHIPIALFISFLTCLVVGSVYFVRQTINLRNAPAVFSDLNAVSEPSHHHNSTMKSTHYTYQLCIMSKVKSLSEFNSCNFVEWIEYHLLMGVSHFYINNDCSPEPSFSKALKYYKQLEVLSVPNENVTVDCANHKPNEYSLMKRTYSSYSNQCEWVSALDMDEFITLHKEVYYDLDKESFANEKDHKVLSTLPELLAISQFPFVRLPWWVIGSDGHEKRPKGLTISNYHKGKLQRYYTKSISKTSEIQEWSSPHNPVPKTPSEILFGNISRQEYVQSGPLFHHEYSTVTLNHDISRSSRNHNASTVHELYIPLNRIFIKHFIYQSWEEFSTQRAAQNVSARGAKNIFKEQPYKKWKAGHGVTNHMLAERFTAGMADKVQEVLKRRLKESTDKTMINLVNKDVFETCSKYWF